MVVFRQLRLPALIGYLLVGILIGPHALGWVADREDTRYLAEFGVVFLMFSVGLEFSLPKLVTMRRVVFGLGAAQVGATTLFVIGLCILFGLGWRAGLVLGGALAMSSTAILAKMLAERLELNSQHGRVIIGVLLFQDLAVVPFLILIPALAHSAEDLAKLLSFALVKAAVVLGVVLFLGQRLMRPWFHLVARQKSPELFMLNLLLFTLGLAWVTGQSGLSLALGAFLAGMLISETEYRYQVEQDIRPFQDVLMGLFFVTIGMQLDPPRCLRRLPWVAALLVALLLFKSLLITGLGRLFGSDPGTALRTGLALCAAGEFGLVLLSQAAGLSVLPPAVVQSGAGRHDPVHADRAVHHREERAHGAAIQRGGLDVPRDGAAQHRGADAGSGEARDHLRLRPQRTVPRAPDGAGERALHRAGCGSSARARSGRGGEHVVFGDAARREVLIAAASRGRVRWSYPMRIPPPLCGYSHVANELRPGMPVVVRTVDDSDIDRLKQAGAAEVVPEIMEGSLMLASHALMLVVACPSIAYCAASVRRASIATICSAVSSAGSPTRPAKNAIACRRACTRW